MGSSVAAEMLDTDLDLPCPGCGYPLWVRVVEVVAQTAITCPACRDRIWLRDDTGSVQNAGSQIERQIGQMVDDLDGALKGWS
jgi:DNA-directed RNA polymerase subunit RPC12/RpoP